MTRKYMTVLVVILILSTLATSALAANFRPPTATQSQPTSWHALTDVLPAYSTIYNITSSPDSQYAVFTADVDVDEEIELYSVPFTGTAPVKLNPPLVSDGRVYDFIITADSRRVIYRAVQEVDQRIELYSVPIQGGPATKLNGPLAINGVVYSYEVDAGTGRVVYIADQDTNDVLELYSVPVEGGAVIKLNPPLVTGGHLFTFKIDPVSDRVVYTADQEADDHFELYSVPITGGAAIKLNMPVSADIVFAFDITPGAANVMFIAKPTGANANQLYINATAGGTAQRRSHDLNPGENVSGFHISPDGTQVVYNVEANMLGGGNLYQTSPFSGVAHILTTAEPGFGVNSYNFVFTPDGERIVCLYQHDAGSSLKLISVKTTGFPVSQDDLYVPENGHFVGSYQISPDSQWVVYEDYSATLELTSSAVPTTGGNTVGFGFVSDLSITPDSQRVVYISLTESINLVSAHITGGDLLNLSQLNGLDVVYEQQISPNGRWVVFAVQLINGNGETTGTQLRASDEIAPALPNFYIYLPVVQR